MIPLVYPIVAGGVFLTGLVLRVRAVAKKKADAAAFALKSADMQRQQQQQALQPTNPLLAPPNNPEIAAAKIAAAQVAAPIQQAAQQAVDLVKATAPNPLLAAKNPDLVPEVPAVPVGMPIGIVTTNDQPPKGDLMVFAIPDANSKQIGGIDKNGRVLILDNSHPTFAKVAWAGGRWPAVEGFARKQFIKVQ